MVKSINLGQDSEVVNLQVVNGKLYFKAKDRSTGVNLWESDGTTLGTKMLTGNLGHGGSDNNCNPSMVVMLGSNIFFFMDSNDYGRELFFDGGVTTDILYS